MRWPLAGSSEERSVSRWMFAISGLRSRLSLTHCYAEGFRLRGLPFASAWTLRPRRNARSFKNCSRPIAPRPGVKPDPGQRALILRTREPGRPIRGLRRTQFRQRGQNRIQPQSEVRRRSGKDATQNGSASWSPRSSMIGSRSTACAWNTEGAPLSSRAKSGITLRKIASPGASSASATDLVAQLSQAGLDQA